MTSVTYFTDRDLGRQFPEALRAAGFCVERHDDHFDQHTADEEWLAECGQRGWIALTHNDEIVRVPAQLETVLRAQVGLVIVRGTVPHALLAEAVIATRVPLERLIQHRPTPFVIRLYRASPPYDKMGLPRVGTIRGVR